LQATLFSLAYFLTRFITMILAIRLALLPVLLTALSPAVKGQQDSTVYLQGLPVSEDDTVQNFPHYDYFPKQDSEIIRYDLLPPKLQRQLKHNVNYKGWDQFPIYFNRHTDIYTIRIKEGGDTTVIGLNKNGKPVTFGENSREEQ
jgi:hypothetical protein